MPRYRILAVVTSGNFG